MSAPIHLARMLALHWRARPRPGVTPARAGAQPRLTAPQGRCARRESARPDPIYMQKNGNAPHVLLVDRDPLAGAAFAALFAADVHVSHVTSVNAALYILRREQFALVVLDPDLPDGDGVILLPAIKDVPLLLHATAHPPWRDRVGAVLCKPWTSHRELWLTVTRLLDIAPGATAGQAV